MKLGIMQPYFFPYIGYFQLISAVDIFIIYDDVQYMKQSWINRNYILLKGHKFLFTLPVKKASYTLPINKREFYFQENKQKLLDTFTQAYRKAPYFRSCITLINDIISIKSNKVTDIVTESIKKICTYLDITTKILNSSYLNIDNKLKASKKVIYINKLFKSTIYVNAIGGKQLYTKEEFNQNGIELFFLKTKEIKYKQFSNEFISNLSIIDVLMFNSKEDVKKLLEDYELV